MRIKSSIKKISSLQTQLYNAQKSAETLRAEFAAEKFIAQLFIASASLINSVHYDAAFKNYMKKHSNTKSRLGQLRCIYEQLAGIFEAISDDDE